MKWFILSLSLFFWISIPAQSLIDYSPPTNIRNGSDYLPGHVDLIWSPPDGWIPSRVDRWFEYDMGIYGGDAFGSCPGCPVEIAIKWDSSFFNFYDSVYISKIRFVLREAPLDHALRIYQVSGANFDTLLNYPLDDDLVYFKFDTLEFDPIPVDIYKELWVSLWISDLGPGYPMAVTWIPDVVNGYSNLIKIYNQGTWGTFLDDFYWDCSWNMGAYLETPDDSIIFPVFSIYRSIDDQPFEKIHEGDVYDTIFHDDITDAIEFRIRYYVNSVYGNGTLVPSDTLEIWTVNVIENDKPGEIKVFPNPAKDHVTVLSGEGKIMSVSLLNTEGKEILNKTVDDNKIELDVSRIPGSFYILKTVTSRGIFSSKLLILK